METTEVISTTENTNLDSATTQEPGGDSVETQVQTEGQEEVSNTQDTSSTLPEVENENPETSEQPEEEFVLKVDGQEIKLTKKDAIAQLQKSYAASKRLEEAANIAKQAAQKEEEFRQIISDPSIILNDPILGKKFREYVENKIIEEIEESKMSPEQLELKRTKSELEKIKTERERIAQVEREKLQKEQEQKYFEHYRTEIKKSIEKNGLPYSDEIVAQYARIIKQNPGKSFDEIAAAVKDYAIRGAESYIKLIDPERLRKVLPEDYLSQLVQVKAKNFKPVVVAKKNEGKEPSSLWEEEFNKKYGL